jgi:4'-phosphopantetheinyl transferase
MIHLSLVRTDINDALLARMTAALSPAEQARAARFRQPADRRRHVVARTVLKGLLAERLGCLAGEIELSTGTHGKPMLAGASLSTGAPLHVNLAHSGELALIALAPVPIGVDLERDPPPDAQALAQAWFTPVEQGRLARGEDDFLTLWTAREAVLKATGTGLSGDPLAFSLPATGPANDATTSPRFERVEARSASAEFDGYVVARVALDAVSSHAFPATLLAPYRAAVSLLGAALPWRLDGLAACRFAPSATLAACAPASVDAACLPH